MNNDWMEDPSLVHIDKEKLLFLQSLVFESQSLSREQLLPFLMASAKKRQASRISFSKEEIEAITSVIRKNASPDEVSKIDKLTSLQHPSRS